MKNIYSFAFLTIIFTTALGKQASQKETSNTNNMLRQCYPTNTLIKNTNNTVKKTFKALENQFQQAQEELDAFLKENPSFGTIDQHYYNNKASRTLGNEYIQLATNQNTWQEALQTFKNASPESFVRQCEERAL